MKLKKEWTRAWKCVVKCPYGGQGCVWRGTIAPEGEGADTVCVCFNFLFCIQKVDSALRTFYSDIQRTAWLNAVNAAKITVCWYLIPILGTFRFIFYILH